MGEGNNGDHFKGSDVKCCSPHLNMYLWIGTKEGQEGDKDRERREADGAKRNRACGVNIYSAPNQI